MTIYLLIAFFSVGASLFVLTPYISITPMSLLPLCLIFIAVLEAFLLKGQQNQTIDEYRLNNTAYSFREIDLSRMNCSKKWLFRYKLISLPLISFFVLYFNSIFKYFSLLIFFLPYLLSWFSVMLENKKNQNIDK